MPYLIKKKNNGKYQVVNIDKNERKAKNTSKTKAEKQVKLLNYIDSKKHK